MKKIIIVLAVAACALQALALMPPHFKQSIPSNGKTFYDKTVILKGYSLKYLNKKRFIVMDLKTKKRVYYRTSLRCRWIGRGNRPGDRQIKCTMTLTIPGAVKGRYYKISYRNFRVILKAG